MNTESVFGMEFLIISLAVVVLLLWFFQIVMRKWFQVEKKPFFSYNHVNRKHAKWDYGIRISFMVVLIVNLLLTLNMQNWLIEPWYLLIIFLILLESVRAIFEKKYADNKNEYKLTISQLLFSVFLIGIFIFIMINF
ncbi:DUF4181 domain-containing protein [Shouchella lehensis]|uniref:DUF4181 domain-containing protein n=1 Tax=Shouchella lehensis TaxID=300825 RepID=A0A4Y7WK18_9BACI|nr:DUF4181 domain-containing protein [Shouchella lehensis]MBG9785954.1 hypothetical protein [Shouchella lehensis]TES48431.1 DUF4181 domain-containing protein [Shouchella lehensis]